MYKVVDPKLSQDIRFLWDLAFTARINFVTIYSFNTVMIMNKNNNDYGNDYDKNSILL